MEGSSVSQTQTYTRDQLVSRLVTIHIYEDVYEDYDSFREEVAAIHALLGAS